MSLRTRLSNPAKLLKAPFMAMAVYGLSVVMLKGFSLITIPLYARYLGPAEYGKLDVAVSVVEFAGLCASLGLADTLYRFASSGAEAERRAAQREVFGTGLAGAGVLAVLAQLLAPAIHTHFGMTLDLWALRAGLFAAAITGLVEMPLAWMRLGDRPLSYLGFVTSRTVVQITLTWLLLAAGHGAASILYSTFAINVASAGVFAVIAARAGGPRLSARGLSNLAHYGLPLVGGGLAMYALGTFDRLFLAHAVSAADIGYYAIAAKLALANSLFVQPLFLWWFPKRIAVLAGPEGVARNAQVWRYGFVILCAGASFTALAMPLFIRFGLPVAYAGAQSYLPWLVLASLVNELVSLSNAGAYRRDRGYEILAVNSLAALVALAGYVALIPSMGIAGAIAATLAAHAVRLALFLWRSRHIAPVPLFTAQAALVALAALTSVLLGWRSDGLAASLGLLLASPLLILAMALTGGMLPMPARLVARAA